MIYKIDLHCHTEYSKCSNISPNLLIKLAMQRGLHGLAITDHNSLEAFKRIRHMALKKFLIIRGCEVTTINGDMLVFGIQEKIPKGLTPEETIDRIHEQGGIAVPAHPFDITRKHHLGRKIFGLKSDAIEIFNSRALLNYFNRKALEVSKNLGMPGIAGSDAHTPQEIGAAYNLLKIVSDEDDVLKAIRKGRIKPCGRLSPIWVHLETSIIKIKKKLRCKKSFF